MTVLGLIIKELALNVATAGVTAVGVMTGSDVVAVVGEIVVVIVVVVVVVFVI